MTARQMFEALLTELAKQGAPNMLLSDFNYFMNKAVNQYVNKRYNAYDTSLLTTDDLRVLKATAILNAKAIYSTENIVNHYGPLDNLLDYMVGNANLFGATYEVNLPDDYLHMLNCICVYKLVKGYKCWDSGNYVLFPARRLTADAWSTIVTNYYLRPLPERPYYYIHNVNTSNNELTPTNKDTDITKPYKVNNNLSITTITRYFYNEEEVEVRNGKIYKKEGGEEIETATISDLTVVTTTTSVPNDKTSDSNFPRTILLGNDWEKDNRTSDFVDRLIAQRYGNPSKVRCEIRYGKDSSVFLLEKVFIDYIKAPLTIRLTLEQVDLTDDISLILEFPDYVCQEIINELVTLVMENNTNLRIQTFNAVTQSIANPAQQLAQQPQPQQRGN